MNSGEKIAVYAEAVAVLLPLVLEAGIAFSDVIRAMRDRGIESVPLELLEQMLEARRTREELPKT